MSLSRRFSLPIIFALSLVPAGSVFATDEEESGLKELNTIHPDSSVLSSPSPVSPFAAEQALVLSREQRRAIQRALTEQGFDTGGVDGIFGRNTRLAIREFQHANGFEPTGFLTNALLELLYSECEIETDEVFKRYHILGEKYLEIRDIVNDSDSQRERIKQIIRAPEFTCSDRFKELNQREIDRLGKLSLARWIQETTRLNICAGLLNKQVEDRLSTETRQTIIQSLVKEADRNRNLESDLINIARDLAYFNNKVKRLLGAYNTNLEVCSLSL